jgi:hypothetical protein
MYTVLSYVLNFYYTTSFHQLTLLMHTEPYTDKLLGGSSRKNIVFAFFSSSSKKRGDSPYSIPVKLFPQRESLVRDIPAGCGTGMSPTFFFTVPAIEDKEEANLLISVH